MPVFIASLLAIVLLFHPNDARLPSELPLLQDFTESAPAGALSHSVLHGDLSMELSPDVSVIVAEKKIGHRVLKTGLMHSTSGFSPSLRVLCIHHNCA